MAGRGDRNPYVRLVRFEPANLMNAPISIAAGLALLAMSVAGAAPDSAAIVDSGSTNRAGFRIVVERSGNAEYTITRQKEAQRLKIPEALAERFYADLKAAQPFPALPQQRCAKSASFGTRLTIEFGEEETPDLSCPDQGNPQIRMLKRDANDIVKLFRTN
jgi:hypothetical protein